MKCNNVVQPSKLTSSVAVIRIAKKKECLRCNKESKASLPPSHQYRVLMPQGRKTT
jgi:hypothetical protein